MHEKYGIVSTLFERLILKDKDGKQHCLPLVGSNLGVEIFLKKREYQKVGTLK